ncbi:MAG: sulfatase [Vicinamibacteria bacterium]
MDRRTSVDRLPLALSLALPIGLCLAALLLLARPSSRDASPFRPWNALAAAAILSVGLWSTVLPRPARWRIVRSTLPAEPAKGRLNFILIVLDTVADRLDLFGYEKETMPNLRKFAREECQAANLMLTTSPWTLPSHASMFTGLYPSAHGAHYPFVADTEFQGVAYPLRDDVPTLAEFLGTIGYETGSIVANGGFLSGFGIPRGFAFYNTPPAATSLTRRTSWLYRLRIGEKSSVLDLIRHIAPKKLLAATGFFAGRDASDPPAREITDLAEDWLSHHGGRPFFLFLNYLDPHVPYVAPRDGPAPLPEELSSYEFSMRRYQAVKRGSGQFGSEELDILRRLYDAELSYLDRELGRLFDALKRSPFYDDTMIIITTDHGESFSDKGYLGHGNDLHSPETGGFLIVRIPRSLGVVRPSPVMQFVDFFPTIAAALNQPIPAHIQGSPWGEGRDYGLSELFCLACSRESRSRDRWPDSLRRDSVAVVIGDASSCARPVVRIGSTESRVMLKNWTLKY